MHRVRRCKRGSGTNTAINTATDACAWRSDQTAGSGADSRHNHADAKSDSPAGDAANKSDCTTGRCRDAAGNAFANPTGRYCSWRIG